MNEPAILVPDGTRQDDLGPPGNEGGAHASLEQRVHRLEEAVSALQDTSLMEERILDRLKQPAPQVKVASPPPASSPAPAPAPDADKVTAEKPVWANLLSEAAAERAGRAPQQQLGGLSELRAMVQMFFDLHYHVAWTTRILALLFIPLIWTSQYWFPPAWVPGIGMLFDKTFDILLAFALYRVLAAEARRYVRYQRYRYPWDDQ